MADAESVSDEIVRFFETLDDEARRAYEELAARDRSFGEDVEKERRTR